MLKFIDNISFIFNCFCTRKEDDTDNKNKREDFFINSIVTSDPSHNMVILPVRSSFELDNLYPKQNHVDKWSTFIIGLDKTYILASSSDFRISNLVNHKGTNIIPNSLEQFLDPIWDRTLEGNQVQLFIVIDKQTYLLNSYALKNNSDKIIGACLFMRLVDSLPNTIGNRAYSFTPSTKPSPSEAQKIKLNKRPSTDIVIANTTTEQ